MIDYRDPFKARVFLTSLLETLLHLPIGFDEAVRTSMRKAKLNQREKRRMYALGYQTVINYYGLKYLAGKMGIRNDVKAVVNLLEKLDYDFENYMEMINVATQELPVEEKIAKKYSYPTWVVKELLKHLPAGEVERTLRNLNEKKRWVRINTVNSTIEEALECLEKEGVKFQRHHTFRDLLRIANPFYPIGNSICFKKGYLILEDLSSYILVENAMKYIGSPILDACSAPGTKLSHALSRRLLKAIAVDYSSKRLLDAKKILKKYINQGNILLVNGDSRILTFNNRFSIVIVDAPCTGSGAVYADPSVKLRLTRHRLRNYSFIQQELVRNVLKLGGNILYATCSIIPYEGEKIVEEIYKEGSIELQELRGEYIDTAYPGYRVSYKTYRIHPLKVEGQGFFISIFRGVG